jgi:hypothetical protein
MLGLALIARRFPSSRDAERESKGRGERGKRSMAINDPKEPKGESSDGDGGDGTRQQGDRQTAADEKWYRRERQEREPSTTSRKSED